LYEPLFYVSLIRDFLSYFEAFHFLLLKNIDVLCESKLLRTDNFLPSVAYFSFLTPGDCLVHQFRKCI